ncbi:MAG TPA: serine/threonine-protein kinase [Gemmatimonadaceae bacterium]
MHDDAPPSPESGPAVAATAASAPRNASAEEDRERVQAAVGDAYRVGRRVGHGQCSAVFRAVRSGKHTELALKLLDIDGAAHPDLVQHLVELTRRVMALIWETPVVPVTLEQYGSAVLLVMPLIETGSVATLLDANEPVPVERVLEIVSQTAAALDTLQDRGLSHRGLTPENILLGRDDQVSLTDVGVTDLILGESGAHGARLSKARAYAAPEQRRGKHVDGRADQYSLAVIAYEMLVGRRRVGVESVEGIDMVAPIEVLADSPLRKDLPLYANLALRRALSASPGNRFPGSTAFAAALSGETMDAATGLPTKRADLSLARRRGIAMGVGALVAVLAGITLIDPRLHAAARDAWNGFAKRVDLPSARVELGATPAGVAPSTPAPSPPNRAGDNQPTSGPAPGATSTPARAGVRQVAATSAPTASIPPASPTRSVVRVNPSSITAAAPDTMHGTGGIVSNSKTALHGASSWLGRMFAKVFPTSAQAGSYVRVTTDKGTALVAIDGIPRGTAPLVASVGAGHHTVSILGSGSYDASTLGVTATPGDTVTVAFHATSKR